MKNALKRVTGLIVVALIVFVWVTGNTAYARGPVVGRAKVDAKPHVWRMKLPKTKVEMGEALERVTEISAARLHMQQAEFDATRFISFLDAKDTADWKGKEGKAKNIEGILNEMGLALSKGDLRAYKDAATRLALEQSDVLNKNTDKWRQVGDTGMFEPGTAVTTGVAGGLDTRTGEGGKVDTKVHQDVAEGLGRYEYRSGAQKTITELTPVAVKGIGEDGKAALEGRKKALVDSSTGEVDVAAVLAHEKFMQNFTSALADMKMLEEGDAAGGVSRRAQAEEYLKALLRNGDADGMMDDASISVLREFIMGLKTGVSDSDTATESAKALAGMAKLAAMDKILWNVANKMDSMKNKSSHEKKEWVQERTREWVERGPEFRDLVKGGSKSEAFKKWVNGDEKFKSDWKDKTPEAGLLLELCDKCSYLKCRRVRAGG